MQLGYTHDAFISFSFKDQKVVEHIVNQLLSQYGIKYWICTRDIRAGQHYDDMIYEAIKMSKVFVLIQSQSSVDSDEVPKEIRLAIKFKKTIIPFVIEDSEWVGGIAYQVINTQEINATRPTLEERIAELAEEIRNVIGEINKDTKAIEPYAVTEELLSTPNIIPKSIFCGREDVLEEIHNRFQNSGNVLFLYGIGGIGKTQIAKQYAKMHKNDYDTIIYATYNGSIKDEIMAETPFTIEPAVNRYTLTDGTKESDEAFFNRKLEKIQKLSTERTLIILDNFDVEEDENLPLLMNGRYRLLITTRFDFSRFYPTVRINPIVSMESLKEIFMKNYQGYDVEEDDPNLVDLIELVNRHTYTIELLAQHMENSGQTPGDMIAALKERGITSLDEEIRNSDMKAQIAYKNLLKMFEIFSLNEEERQILMYLSLMPTEGVDVKNFKKWADLKSTKILKNLENRSWIIRNTDGIAVHPIISEVIKHEIPATEDNCFDFINRFSESISETHSWHYKKIDKDKYSAIVKRLLSIFKVISPKTESLYNNSEALLSFAVDPEYAVRLAERLYEYYHAIYPKESYEVGRAAFKLGWVYAYNLYISNAVNHALNWLSKADRILSNVNLITTEMMSNLTQTKVNLAKMHLILFEMNKKQEDYLMAKGYAEFNVKYSLNIYRPGDPQYGKLAGAYWQLADVLLTGGELENALENIEKSLDILISLNTEDDSDSMHALNRKAAILYAMGQYREAKLLAHKSAVGYAEYFGENTTIVAMFLLLGDCCTALSERDEAMNAYETALKIAEKLYAPDARQIIEIRSKLD